MKKILFSLLLLSLTISCSDEDKPAGTGRVSISLTRGDVNSSGGKLKSFDDIAKIFVSIETDDGIVIHDLEPLTVLKLGESIISEELQLVTGNFKLTKFFAADANGNVLYATPLVESELEDLVEKPLPISFTVQTDQVLNMDIEVVEVSDGLDGEDFGYVSFQLNQASCSLVRIRANTLGINDIGYVKTWVMNTETLQRQWVTLTQSSSSVNIWEGKIILENGDYSLETLVKSELGEPGYMRKHKIANVEQLQFKVSKSITASFENLNDNPPFRLSDFDRLSGFEHQSSDFEYHMILTSSDPCDFSYKIYVGNDLCDSYVYLDRFFWNGTTGEILAYSFKELVIGTNSCLGYPPGIENVENTGVLTGTMSSLNAEVCALAVEEAGFIDGMLISAGVLENGQEIEPSYDFVFYRYPQSQGGKVVQQTKIDARKKFLPKSVLKQIE